MFIRLPGRKSGKGSDAELIKEFISSGDLEILGTLYSEYMHLVYGVCLKYLKDREESMDAVMQIFEKLISEVPKQDIYNFRSWLHTVTRNFCLMKLRTQKSEDGKMKNWITETQNFVESGQDMHPIDEEDPEMDKALQDCIDKLKDEQKKCIRMFYFENRSYIEIAGDLGLDEKKVKSHLQNGKRNLKICLEERNGKK